jgi:DNA-binding HxlR family transcriptional regulator
MIIKHFASPEELTLTLIGGKWKALILRRLLAGESRRFGELKRSLNGISAKMLAKHLRELEYDGLVTRIQTGGDRPRIVYAPTTRSRSLAPILEAIQKWGAENQEVYGRDPWKPADQKAGSDAPDPARVVVSPSAPDSFGVSPFRGPGVALSS